MQDPPSGTLPVAASLLYSSWRTRDDPWPIATLQAPSLEGDLATSRWAPRTSPTRVSQSSLEDCPWAALGPRAIETQGSTADSYGHRMTSSPRVQADLPKSGTRPSGSRTSGRSEPTYFCGNCAPDWTESPRRTHQLGCISHPNQTKKPPSHPSLRGAADSSRLQPF
jgi:hypothetical protein